MAASLGKGKAMTAQAAGSRPQAPAEEHFFKGSSAADLWQRYCGFLDLKVSEFMEIQRFLLLEQLRLISNTPLGAKFIRGPLPDSLESFRRTVPITTYTDFEN